MKKKYKVWEEADTFVRSNKHVIKIGVIIVVAILGIFACLNAAPRTAEPYKGEAGVYVNSTAIDKDIITEDFIVRSMHISLEDFIEIMKAEGIGVYGTNDSDIDVLEWYNMLYLEEGWDKNITWEE